MLDAIRIYFIIGFYNWELPLMPGDDEDKDL
jgi:hypothetical protein